MGTGVFGCSLYIFVGVILWGWEHFGGSVRIGAIFLSEDLCSKNLFIV